MIAETSADLAVGRTDPTPSAFGAKGSQEPDFSIQLFGSLSVRCHGERLPRMRSRKEQWLLALLVLRARISPIDRIWLSGTLWPESDESKALFYLRRSLSLLRDALGPEAARISSPTPRTLFFDLAGARCDVAEFDDALRRDDDASLLRAIDLYRGSLLGDCSEDWVFPERDNREQGVLFALDKMVSRTKASGESLAHISHLRRILELDPLRESSVRDLLKALAADGSPAAAGESFRVFQARLRRDHNADPDAETVRLHQRIQTEARERSETSALRTPATADSPLPAFASVGRSASLPTALSPLIGRQAERDAVVTQLDASRLVTLTGTGGMGKTRLSLEVAESIANDFADGICFVDLTTISGSRLIVKAVLVSLGAVEFAGQPDLVALQTYLQSKHLLLVMDNCEHVVAECARLVHSLLKSCPDLKVLATSREPLRIPEEIVWPVPRLAPDDAAQLFSIRAAQASATFRTASTSFDSVKRICERLEGVPLAIEMAAARTRGMSAEQIAVNLDGAFRLLNIPGGHIEPRHQTLRATMTWSYDLLTPAERVLFARLAIFSGGWTLEAAETVCGDDPLTHDSVLETLLTLVEKSLVIYIPSDLDVGRYTFLEMTRQYAAELLDPAERASLSDTHAEYFSRKAMAMRYMQGRQGEHEAVNSFELELPNVRNALQWCQSAGRVQCGLRLAGCLGKFWLSRGHISEGRQCVAAALDAVQDADYFLEERVIGLMCLGILAQNQRDFDEARRRFAEALPLAQALDGDRHMARLFPDPSLTASVLFNLGVAQMARDDRMAARDSLSDALTRWTTTNAEQGMAKARHVLGQLALTDCDFDAAEMHLNLALEFFESSGNLYFVSQVLLDIASVLQGRGIRFPEFPEELEEREMNVLKRVVSIAPTFDGTFDLAIALDALAQLAARHRRFEDAARLYGACETLRESLTDFPRQRRDLAIRESCLADGREALSEAAIDTAFQEGLKMPRGEVIEFARAL